MTTQQSDPRGSAQPTVAGPQPAVSRRSYPTSGYPRARAFVWGASLLAGGLGAIVLFFIAIGVIDLYQHSYLGVVGAVLVLFFGATMWSFARSERRGNSRWADRERRGF